MTRGDDIDATAAADGTMATDGNDAGGAPGSSAAADRRSLWRGFVVAVVAVLVLTLGVGLLAELVRPGADPRPAGSAGAAAPSPAPTTSNPSTDALASQVQRVLDRRAAALAAGDLAGWLTPLDPAATEFVGRQREAFAVLRELDVRTVRWTVARVLAQTAAGLSRVEVAGEWTVPGVDPAPAPFVTVFTVRSASSAPSSWPSTGSTATSTTISSTISSTPVLVDDDDPGTTRQAFDLTGAQVVRHGRAIVLGTAPSDRLEFYARAADEGLGEVSRVWTPVPTRVLVLAPATGAELRTLSGRVPASGDQVAAVTYGSVAQGRTARGDRVILNPTAWDRLSAAGREIVVTHELTHVSVRASTTHAPPLWVSEGFATWVAYRAHPVDEGRTAGPAVEHARSGEPQQLPAEGAFSSGDVDLAYAQAWTACRYLADRSGPAALVDLSRRVGAGESLAAALHASTGLTEQALVTGWSRSLQSSDSSGPP
ncbi:hypothetical protein MM440_13005 [Arsenicicoccus piscis]|uniref:hypothetical protein n=1 Tax=Arsenicicoccus piscis TaxID=673954 RepID=UPI001F4CA208|nr:hypothetical protein [Arsenicicoccus piscis]MCH8628654.1 hypothetical protein [Arsenicicoccus piscis]